MIKNIFIALILVMISYSNGYGQWIKERCWLGVKGNWNHSSLSNLNTLLNDAFRVDNTGVGVIFGLDLGRSLTVIGEASVGKKGVKQENDTEYFGVHIRSIADLEFNFMELSGGVRLNFSKDYKFKTYLGGGIMYSLVWKGKTKDMLIIAGDSINTTGKIYFKDNQNYEGEDLYLGPTEFDKSRIGVYIDAGISIPLNIFWGLKRIPILNKIDILIECRGQHDLGGSYNPIYKLTTKPSRFNSFILSGGLIYNF